MDVQKPRVLLVEDESITRRVAEAMLAAAGADVTAVASGGEAVEAVTAAVRRNFVLIIMDLGLPDFDGIEATRRIRARKVLTPILGLTATCHAGTREACLEAGMDAVTEKGLHPDALRELVKRYAAEDLKRRGAA